MNEWYNLIQSLAVGRIDQIEQHLSRHPLEHPQFTEAAQKIDAAMEETDSHPNPELTERDNLWMSYSAELAIEMYLAGARDGGRVYHAFVSGELPSIQKHEENTMNRPTSERLKALREQYPKGCRVRLNHMNDPYRPDLKVGALGTVLHVDDIGTIHVSWDCGSSLGVVLGEDSCTRIDEEDAHD